MTPVDLVIFDFCDTLVKGQTADPFLTKLLRKDGRTPFIFWANVLAFLNKLSPIFMRGNRKKILLAGLKGLSVKSYEIASKEYAKDILLPNIKPKTLDRMKRSVTSGAHVIVVSGGFSQYIRDFLRAIDLPDVDVIANDPQIVGQTLTGDLLWPDCMGIEKIRRLKHYLTDRALSPARTAVYSDHESDMPLFAIADEKYIVPSETNLEFQELFPWVILR